MPDALDLLETLACAATMALCLVSQEKACALLAKWALPRDLVKVRVSSG
jgi:hypothetical protein